jgi:hypothetical protein
MLFENEGIMILLGFCVFIFLLLNQKLICHIMAWRLLFASYCCMLSGWIFTVAEGFFLANILNILEHLSYLGSALLFAFWFRIFMKRGQEESL